MSFNRLQLGFPKCPFLQRFPNRVPWFSPRVLRGTSKFLDGAINALIFGDVFAQKG